MPDEREPGTGNREPGPAWSDARVEAVHQELILDHYRRPRNRRALEGAARMASLRNPFCGDELTVYVALDGDTVREATFTGQGCSITQAAASMLTGAVRGRAVDEARDLLARYAAMLAPGGEAAEEGLGELRALSGVRRLPARVGCARMAERALVRALGGEAAQDDAPGAGESPAGGADA